MKKILFTLILFSFFAKIPAAYAGFFSWIDEEPELYIQNYTVKSEQLSQEQMRSMQQGMPQQQQYPQMQQQRQPQNPMTMVPAQSLAPPPSIEQIIAELDDDEVRHLVNSVREGNAQRDFARSLVSPKPAVICAKSRCTRLGGQYTKDFLYNALISLFSENQSSKGYICDSNPNIRSCNAEYIGFNGMAGGTEVMIKIPSFSVNDVKFTLAMKRVGLMLTFDMLVNNLSAQCIASYNTIDVKSTEQIIMKGDPFTCRLTSGVPSDVSLMTSIDYVDLDNAIVGGYYSLAMNGEAYGSNQGYLIFRLEKPAKIKPDDLLNSYIPGRDTEEKTRENLAPGEYLVRPLT